MPANSHQCLSLRYKRQLQHGGKLTLYVTEKEDPPELVYDLAAGGVGGGDGAGGKKKGGDGGGTDGGGDDDDTSWQELQVSVNGIETFRLKVITEIFQKDKNTNNDDGNGIKNNNGDNKNNGNNTNGSWIAFKSFTLTDGNCSHGLWPVLSCVFILFMFILLVFTLCSSCLCLSCLCSVFSCSSCLCSVFSCSSCLCSPCLCSPCLCSPCLCLFSCTSSSPKTIKA